MRSACTAGASLFVAWLLVVPAPAADDPPKMKFNEVKEIAPGVFFRYSAISATDKIRRLRRQQQHLGRLRGLRRRHRRQLPQGGRATSSRRSRRRPISRSATSSTRTITATMPTATRSSPRPAPASSPQANCARLLRINGPKEFADAGKGPNGRKDVAESTLKVPNVDLRRQAGAGRRHAAGRVPLPRPRPHGRRRASPTCRSTRSSAPATPASTAPSTSWATPTPRRGFASWRRCSSSTSSMVCPGHGPMAGKDLLEKQKRYFVELRKQVQKGIDAGKTCEDIAKDLDMPWYKEWTGVQPTRTQRPARLRRADRPRRPVGPGRGFRHLRGAVADQGHARAGSRRARSSCRPA